MSCICQYIGGATSSMGNGNEERIAVPLPNPNENRAVENEGPCDPWQTPITDDAKIAASVSELVKCRAENWLLKKKLAEHEVNIQSLEQLITSIVNKQNENLTEIFQLRKRNQELQTECQSQREYHSLERDALIKELQNVKTINRELDSDANEDVDEDGANQSATASEEYDENQLDSDDSDDESQMQDTDDDEEDDQVEEKQHHQIIEFDTDDDDEEEHDGDDEAQDQQTSYSDDADDQSDYVDTETSDLESENEDQEY